MFAKLSVKTLRWIFLPSILTVEMGRDVENMNEEKARTRSLYIFVSIDFLY